jgi:hypothetical protein
MKWFDKWFANRCKQAWDLAQRDNEVAGLKMNIASDRVREGLSAEPIRINVFNARGGKIVEVRTYDNTRDRNNGVTYIITDQQDFTEELGKIISMESLKL